MKRWLWIVVVVALFGSAIYFALPSGEGEETSRRSGYSKVVPAVLRDLQVTITASGVVDPLQTVEVKSKASGEILEMPVDEGDFVRKGDLVCRLDASTVRTQHRQAEADYTVARVTVEQRAKELERQKSLFERGLIAEADFDMARLSHEQAKSQLVRAEAQLENAVEAMQDTEVRAALDGIVLTRNVEVGQIISSGISNVSGGTLICRVAQVDTVFVRAQVDEIDVGNVFVGQPAKVTADAFQSQPFSGTVLKIAPMAQSQQNVTTFEVTVLIDNSEGLLKAGMNATVDITTAEANGVLAVPVDAVQNIPEGMGMRAGGEGHEGGEGMRRGGEGRQGGPPEGMDPERLKQMRERRKNRQLVLVISGTDTIPKPVVTGLSNLDYVEIKRGLEEGDSVLVQPQSMMMADRERFMERMRSWNSVPGIGR